MLQESWSSIYLKKDTIIDPCLIQKAHPAFDESFLVNPNLILSTDILQDLYSEKLQIL